MCIFVPLKIKEDCWKIEVAYSSNDRTRERVFLPKCYASKDDAQNAANILNKTDDGDILNNVSGRFFFDLPCFEDRLKRLGYDENQCKELAFQIFPDAYIKLKQIKNLMERMNMGGVKK